jgi:hypothetical protein
VIDMPHSTSLLALTGIAGFALVSLLVVLIH